MRLYVELAFGGVEAENESAAFLRGHHHADARALHADGADGVGGEHVHRHAQAHVAGGGEGGGGDVGRERVGKQGYAGGFQGFDPHLHQRQGGVLQVFSQRARQFAPAVAEGEGRAHRLAFGQRQFFGLRQLGGKCGGSFGALLGFEPLSGVDFRHLSGGDEARQPGGAGERAGVATVVLLADDARGDFARAGVRVVGKAGAKLGHGRVGRQGGFFFAAGHQNHGQGEPLRFIVGFGLQHVVHRRHDLPVGIRAGGHAQGDGEVEVEVLRQHAVYLRPQGFGGDFARRAAACGLHGVHQQLALHRIGGIGAGVGEVAVFGHGGLSCAGSVRKKCGGL